MVRDMTKYGGRGKKLKKRRLLKQDTLQMFETEIDGIIKSSTTKKGKAYKKKARDILTSTQPVRDSNAKTDLSKGE